MTPVGWQNLSPTRRKANDRSLILPQVEAIYPNVKERQLADNFIAYSLDDDRLVAVAWFDRSWIYVIMSKTAFDISDQQRYVQLSILPLPDQNFRIIPSPRPQYQPCLYPEGSEWFVEFDTPKGVQKFGPYPSYDAANTDTPALIRQVAANISSQ